MMSTNRLWFLEGANGVGKSTLLGAALVPYWNWIGGFTSHRNFNRGQGVRFVLAPLHPKKHTGKMRDDGIPVAFLITKDGKSHFDPSPFEESACQWIEEERANGISLFLLDEIGGLELIYPNFTSILLSLFESDAICLGIFKSEENSARLLQRVALSEEECALYYANRARLLDCIHTHGSLREVTLSNRGQIRKDTDHFLQMHLDGK